MNRQNTKLNHAVSYQPLAVIVAAWDRDRVTPGSNHYLGVTLTNRGTQDAVVQVRLESPSPLLDQWCTQPEQWLALAEGKSGELTFCIAVPGDALPQWLDYEVVARPQGGYTDAYLPPTRCRLQVLAPETSEIQQDPTFSLSPITAPDRPLLVQPGTPIAVELTMENRSERVDRFRLECTGLPSDWTIQVEYPQDFEGLGLVRASDSLGVNPGDRGSLRLILQPPPLPLAGNYLPTLRLSSQNDPALGLLGLVYLRVNPVYQLQAQLQVVRDQVRDRPAQFTVLFANLGNTPRQVQALLKPLPPREECTYSLSSEPLTLPPQTNAQLLLEGQPQRWWMRPWFGTGKLYPFQITITDPEQHPVTPDTLQGYLTWMARPWWQLLLLALAGLGVLGSLAFLIWWLLLRPPTPPEVLEFATEDSHYSEANGDMARVRWQIDHPEQIQTLKLTGYSPDGMVLSGPLVYEFKDGNVPAALQSFCTRQKTLLSCSQIRTDAFQPGKYVFELTLQPQGRRVAPIRLKTSAIEITSKPLPMVTALVPKALLYREAAAGSVTAAERAIPVVDRAGIRLDWVVTRPEDIAALHLVGRDQAGKMIGDVWFEFPHPGQVPDVLRSFCQMGQTLVCRNVPTGLNRVGEHKLELQVFARGKSEATEAKPRSTEVIKIQPQTPQILHFQINGREAPAKLVIVLGRGQVLPSIQVSWHVQGGANTRVELLPAPGSVSPIGQVSFPLSQGSTTLTLQVKLPTGESLTRSVTLEVLNPPVPSPVPAAPSNKTPATGETSAPAGTSPAGTSNSPTPPPFGAPAPTTDDRLSPNEQPPQFNPSR
jgi:hypothetical protein